MSEWINVHIERISSTFNSLGFQRVTAICLYPLVGIYTDLTQVAWKSLAHSISQLSVHLWLTAVWFIQHKAGGLVFSTRYSNTKWILQSWSLLAVLFPQGQLEWRRPLAPIRFLWCNCQFIEQLEDSSSSPADPGCSGTQQRVWKELLYRAYLARCKRRRTGRAAGMSALTGTCLRQPTLFLSQALIQWGSREPWRHNDSVFYFFILWGCCLLKTEKEDSFKIFHISRDLKPSTILRGEHY